MTVNNRHIPDYIANTITDSILSSVILMKERFELNRNTIISLKKLDFKTHDNLKMQLNKNKTADNFQ